MCRALLIGFPVKQHAVAVGFTLRIVGIQQPDDGRFQPFGFMHGVDTQCVAYFTYLAFIRRIAFCRAQFAQLGEEARQTGITPGIDVECNFHKGLKIGAHGFMQFCRQRSRVAMEHVTFEINAVKQVMHGKFVGKLQPTFKQTLGAS